MVTFIIGNGFDIQMGLNTRYSDFYKVYTEIKEKDSELIKWFKGEISKDWENWADFELGMGRFSKEFNNTHDFRLFPTAVGDNIQAILNETSPVFLGSNYKD